MDQIAQGMRRLHYRQVKSSSEIVTQQSFGKSAAVSVCPSVFSGSQSPVCPSIHLSVCPCVRRSVCLCVRVSICPSVRLSVCLSARLFPFIRPSIGVRLSVRLSACSLLVCESVNASMGPCVRPSICLSVLLSVSPPVHLSACPSVRLSVCPLIRLSDYSVSPSFRVLTCPFVHVCLSVSSSVRLIRLDVLKLGQNP